MLERSIPQYRVMREVVGRIASDLVRERGGAVVDLGCANGGAIQSLVNAHGPHQRRYFGVDLSGPMLDAARERFAGSRDLVSIEALDLRTSYPDVGVACLTLAVLTLQFVPINYRQRIVSNVYKTTGAGGAFILVEKVLGTGADIDDQLVRHYHELKARNGYSTEAIERKRLALEGVLVPMTARWNEDLLRDAGFREVDCFWRHLNFAAWLALK